MADNGSLRRPKSCINQDTYMQRSFAHLSMASARSSPMESRKQIVSQVIEPSTPMSSMYSSNSNIFSFNSSWFDVIDNSDFERNLERQEKETENASDAVKQISTYPKDDVDVKIVKRTCRTETPIMPEVDANSTSHLMNCIQAFTDDWTVIEHKYADKRSGILVGNKDSSNQEPVQSIHEYEETDNRSESNVTKTFASSSTDLNMADADELVENIFDNVPQETVDEENSKKRKDNRPSSIFSLFSINPSASLTGILADEQEMPIEHTVAPPLPKDHMGYRILLKCLSLEMEVDIEPVFVSLAMYDVQNKKKISETFYFDLNKDNIKKMLKENIQPDIPTLSRSAIFSVTYPSHDVYLVIRLEKVLQQGDISECMEPYLKDSTDKCKEKAKGNAHWFCEKLHKYRMPFAWTAIHLMNVVNKAENLKPMEETIATNSSSDSLQSRNGTLSSQTLNESELSMLTSFKAVTITVSSFFKQEADRLSEEDLFKYLQDLRRPTKLLKGIKCIPVKLKLDVSPCPENFAYCLTPELFKVTPYPDSRGRPTREILEFAPKEVNIPNIIYRNLMYVYPKSVNFSNRPGHARNIAIKIQLMSGEEPDKAEKSIFGKSSCEEFCSETYTSVLYHSKSPDFYEEIKIKLPANLTDNYHLLFTFYHISCQKKQDVTPIETLVGYSWLPLLQNGHLRIGDVSLPVSMDKLPSSYSLHSSESTIPGVKWVDGRKPVFSLSIKSISTVHTMDRHLDAFFNVCNAVDQNCISKPDDAEQRLKVSMEKMANSSQLEALVHFLYIILNKIVHLLIRPPIVSGQTINVSQTCFESICVVVMKIHKSLPLQSDIQGRNLMLASYAHYVFRPDVLHSRTSQVGNVDDGLGTMGGNHYATISKVASKTRPALLSGTFHLSSSNPDLSTPPTTPDQSPTQENVSTNFLRHSNTRSSLMDQPQQPRKDSTGVRTITRKIFHEELALLWSVSTSYVKENALQQSWFLFELMHKSMTQHVSSTVGLTSRRNDRFPARFLDDLSRLVKIITTEIIANYSKNGILAEHLNMSLAFFLRDILSIMNRGFVFQLITDYSQQIGTKIASLNSPANLLSIRLALMRIICSHEHYPTLNLPFLAERPSSPTPSVVSTVSALSMFSVATAFNTDYDITDQFIKRHFLVGILLSDLQVCVEMGETVSVVGPQLYAITSIMNLMKSHDVDDRIKNYPEVKEKITSLYMPLLMIALKALFNIHDFDLDVGSTLANSEDSGISEVIDPKTANAIANTSAVVMSKTQQTAVPVSTKMSSEASKKLLICVLWLLKNSNQTALREFISALAPLQVNSFLELLNIAVSCFEYKSPPASSFTRGEPNRSSHSHKDRIDRLQGAILGLGDMSARKEMLMRRRGDRFGSSLSKDEGEKGLRWRKDRTEYKKSKGEERNLNEFPFVTKDLAAESTLLILDTMELVIDCATETNTVGTILTSALKLLLHSLSSNQSIAVLKNVFAIQRSIIARFPELVFEEEIEQCADLCSNLLQRCSSNVDEIRTNATASLYLLMRHNFSVGNTFARVKMQITMSLSSLVGSSSHKFDEVHLRKSLKTILVYAESDTDLANTSFPEQVQDLMFNLHTILCDTVKMKEHQDDPEMLIDLMYRIAKGYQNSPDLRLTWLQNMAQQHIQRQNNVEAGMCLIHSAALVAEYLSMVEEKEYLPIGCNAFRGISSNILEESAVSDDVVSPHEDGVCTEKFFSLHGFLALLESAIVSFQSAGIYEIVNKIYQMMMPIYNHYNNHKKLATIHSKLHDCFMKIKNQDGKRMFGTYFRIGFYGSKFGDLNGEEYIYKEPAITKLPEISHRLQNFYEDCFGASNVEILKDSNKVQVDKLDPEKAYIQITFVEPYFYKWEEISKETYFDLNFNIRRFIYCTPYTLEGKSHGTLKDQYKRKTIVEVAHTFPYMKTRSKVIRREEIILTPLETACEDVQKKSKQLLKVATQNPVDTRMLQVNLQGSVLTTVNQGPMEVAQTFLTSIPDDPKMYIPFNQLRLAFRDFDYACSIALKKNKTLIASDQKEYQRELERNYSSLTERLKPMYQNRDIMQKIRATSYEELGVA